MHLRGPTSKEMEGEGRRERKGEGRDEMEGENDLTHPLSQIPGYATATATITPTYSNRHVIMKSRRPQ